MERALIEKEKQSGSGLMEAETARAIQEVQASMIIAKRFPRDQEEAYLRIMKACERYSLADQAEYAYPRGDYTVSGPSIRLAECLAQNWGNLQFGIRELSNEHGKSEIEAFAWDLETNTRQIKAFKVEHKRYTKKSGNVDLTDPRDIYEHVANQGARRMRACILGVIPGDIVEAALKKCHETVKKGIKAKPLIDQIRLSLKAFDSLGVTKAMIEARLGHSVETITEDELIELNNIGRSIKDNMTSRQDWFDIKAEEQKKASSLTETVLANGPTPENEPVRDTKELRAGPKKEGNTNIRDEYINLKSAGFSTWVYKNIDRIKSEASVTDQTEIREKWNKLYEEPYPLDPKVENPGKILEEQPLAPRTTEGSPLNTNNHNIILCPKNERRSNIPSR